jgi:hypothetical protein
MSINVGLDSIVKKEMGDMISAHSLDLVVIGGNEVLLKSSTYVMDVVADRNGVSVVYFDTMQKPVKGYNVFLFLANKRRGQLALTKSRPITNNFSEFVESETRALAGHLRKAGQDILIGSKDWMREYSWPTVHLGDDIAAMI